MTGRSYFRSSAILAELLIETPFVGYKTNKAIFS